MSAIINKLWKCENFVFSLFRYIENNVIFARVRRDTIYAQISWIAISQT